MIKGGPMESLVNNTAQNRFEYHSQDGIAICEYEESDGIWYLNHTSVPDSMRGQGVAGKLAEFAINHIDAQNGKIVPRCSYIAAYIEKHPQFARLLASGK